MKCFTAVLAFGMAWVYNPKTAEAFCLGCCADSSSLRPAVSLTSSRPCLDHAFSSSTSSSLHYMDSRNHTSEEEQEQHIRVHTNKDAEDKQLTLIPLSREPLLLVSSKPLLTLQECHTLRGVFERDDDSSQEGRALLQRVQDAIDELVGGEEPTHHNRNNEQQEASLPRFVRYPPRPSSSQEEIFPDGLHFDITPIMASLTFLLYLTTNENGATSFPLAATNPILKNNGESNVDDDARSTRKEHKDLIETAQILLDSGMTHTLDECQTDENVERCKRLVMAGNALYEKDTSTITTMGIRVLPRAGTLCVFGNLLDNGQADPQSLHGGEGRNEQEKVLLTFFKEIPVESFESRAEFEQCAAETRRYMLQRYYNIGME